MDDIDIKEDFTLKDVFDAYFDCRKHKRNKISSLEFEYDLENNIIELYNDLKNGTYKIGRCICFIVTTPKPREVWAANFRDRIVHHLVYNAIKDRFHKRFIKDTYSCIPKRGTLAAARRVLQFSRSSTNNYTKKMYYLKADLSNFFVSIDKDILFNELKRQITEEWILKLIEQILYHDPRTNVYRKSPKSKFKLLPKHKSLYNSDNSHGLPIGNLTSQFFSNVYLNVLDQYVKHTLKAKYYCRYVDDFIIIHENPSLLNLWFNQINSFATENLNLFLHPNKKMINNVSSGMDFVGFVVKPHRIFLRQRTIKRIFLCVLRWINMYNPFSKENLLAFYKTVNSYFGMMINLNCFQLRYKLGAYLNSLFLKPDIFFTKIVLC